MKREMYQLRDKIIEEQEKILHERHEAIQSMAYLIGNGGGYTICIFEI